MTMKNTCLNCDYEGDLPAEFVNKMMPPDGAIELVNMEGCQKCGDGDGGMFAWKMPDGKMRHALSGIDDLEEQGVTVLNPYSKSHVRK